MKLAGDEKSRLLFIANDGPGSAISKQARGFRLYHRGDALAAAFVEDALGEGVGDDSFVVIGDDQRMEAGQAGFDGANQGLLDGGRERVAMLAIDAHDLLMARDDARLERGRALGVGDTPLDGMPSAVRQRRRSRAASSAPVTPKGVTLAPSAARLAATLPAPPRHEVSETKSTTGTAASGERRLALPQT